MLKKEEYLVKSIPRRIAKKIIEAHHYAKSMSNTSVATHGLFKKEGLECLGVTVWIPPPSPNAARAVHPESPEKVLSLSRLVIIPNVPQNAATFLLARSVRLLMKYDSRWEILVTYADEWQGHDGTIYKASNWDYTGRTGPYPVWVDNKGNLVRRKVGPKTLSVSEMRSKGFKNLGLFYKHRFILDLRKFKKHISIVQMKL